MLEDFQEQQRKKAIRARSFMDYTMGVILVLIGAILLFSGFTIGNLPAINRKLLGGLFILYGIWRIYRGYKKNYYR